MLDSQSRHDVVGGLRGLNDRRWEADPFNEISISLTDSKEIQGNATHCQMLDDWACIGRLQISVNHEHQVINLEAWQRRLHA